MAKYNIYAIAYGIDPVLVEPVSNLKFRTWDDCKPYVIGVEGAKYKGFLTEEEADKEAEDPMQASGPAGGLLRPIRFPQCRS